LETFSSRTATMRMNSSICFSKMLSMQNSNGADEIIYLLLNNILFVPTATWLLTSVAGLRNGVLGKVQGKGLDWRKGEGGSVKQAFLDLL